VKNGTSALLFAIPWQYYGMDALDKNLLTEIQKRFPLESTPYASLGKRLGLSEEEVLARLKNLKEKGILRQIGAIFNPQALGFKTSLVAAAAPKYNFKKAAEIINAYPGVSHNYLRDHFFNLWFTIAVPPGEDLKSVVASLMARAQVERYLLLPILKIFHIAVVYDFAEENNSDEVTFSLPEEKFFTPDEKTISLVRLTQEDLPRVSRPFKELGKKVGLSEEEVISWLKKGLETGMIRRFAGLVRHNRAGLRGNVMVAWQIPQEKLDQVGKFLAKEKKITHCYERKSYPDWPYNLYTMIHARELDEAMSYVKSLASQIDAQKYLPLITLKELKKIRLKLFW